MPVILAEDNALGDALHLNIYELSGILFFNNTNKASATTAGLFIITTAESSALTAGMFHSLTIFNNY